MATQVNRLHGRYAVCSIGSVVANLYEWEVEITTDFADGTAHGDLWDVPVPLKYSWTARARARMTMAQQASLLTSWNATVAGTADVASVTFIGYNTYTSLTTGKRIFQADGFPVRARWAAAIGSMVEQELELRGTGLPTLIP